MAIRIEQRRRSTHAAPTAAGELVVPADECTNFLRGLRVALALALPLWALVAAAVLALLG